MTPSSEERHDMTPMAEHRHGSAVHRHVASTTPSSEERDEGPLSLVERLRARARWHRPQPLLGPEDADLLDEAANQIEQDHQALRRLERLAGQWETQGNEFREHFTEEPTHDDRVEMLTAGNDWLLAAKELRQALGNKGSA